MTLISLDTGRRGARVPSSTAGVGWTGEFSGRGTSEGARGDGGGGGGAGKTRPRPHHGPPPRSTPRRPPLRPVGDPPAVRTGTRPLHRRQDGPARARRGTSRVRDRGPTRLDQSRASLVSLRYLLGRLGLANRRRLPPSGLLLLLPLALGDDGA